MRKVKLFTLTRYVEAALTGAEYVRDKDNVVISQGAGSPGRRSKSKMSKLSLLTAEQVIRKHASISHHPRPGRLQIHPA